MSLRLFIAILSTIVQPLVLLASQDIPDDSILHGTINVALGNKNGIVLLTG
jgi:hypothetical protein